MGYISTDGHRCFPQMDTDVFHRFFALMHTDRNQHVRSRNYFEMMPFIPTVKEESVRRNSFFNQKSHPAAPAS